MRLGLFGDKVDRAFDQDTFSNAGDQSTFEGDFEDFWSDVFPGEDHPIVESNEDVDYDGDQDISAWYTMLSLPLDSRWSLVGGARFESTDTKIRLAPEDQAFWFPPGETAPVQLNPGDADVDFDQDDVLPAVGLTYQPNDKWTLRAAYSETVARQTFKELTPVIQQEFLGGPIFIGNPELEMSALKNYDLRLDYTPYPGGLVSLSWFKKDIEDPIENVQALAAIGFTYTTPVNYPKGELRGYEIELRQHLGEFWGSADGLNVGANATFIDSKVTLTDAEQAGFADPGIDTPFTTRDATNAPEHLYNLYLTYDFPTSESQFSVFYTVRGDTLVAGAAQANGNFVPNVYAKEFGSLNLSFSHRFSKHWSIQIQAKNLTNPEIEEVYRSDFTGTDVTNTSFTRGREFSFGLNLTL